MGCGPSQPQEIPEDELVEIRAQALKQASAAFAAEREKLKRELADVKAELLVTKGDLVKVRDGCHLHSPCRTPAFPPPILQPPPLPPLTRSSCLQAKEANEKAAQAGLALLQQAEGSQVARDPTPVTLIDHAH